MPRQFKDVTSNFKPNPISGEPSIAKDERAIIQSVKNLILTDQGERPFQPEIGSTINGLLFEPASPLVLDLLEDRVETVIENFEPRVELDDVTAKFSVDENRIEVTLQFRISTIPGQIETQIFLDRVL